MVPLESAKLFISWVLIFRCLMKVECFGKFHYNWDFGAPILKPNVQIRSTSIPMVREISVRVLCLMIVEIRVVLQVDSERKLSWAIFNKVKLSGGIKIVKVYLLYFFHMFWREYTCVFLGLFLGLIHNMTVFHLMLDSQN